MKGAERSGRGATALVVEDQQGVVRRGRGIGVGRLQTLGNMMRTDVLLKYTHFKNSTWTLSSTTVFLSNHSFGTSVFCLSEEGDGMEEKKEQKRRRGEGLGSPCKQMLGSGTG